MDDVWVDKQDNPPFEGALILFNLGNENYKAFPSEYFEKIKEAVNQAHADGWAILYLFDQEIMAMTPPEELEFVESSDFSRLANKTMGVPTLRFPFMPEDRLCYIKGLLLSLEDPLGQFKIDGRDFIIAGQCYIGKEKVFLPLTKVTLS